MYCSSLVGSRYAMSIFGEELVCIVNFWWGVGMVHFWWEIGMHHPFLVGSRYALLIFGGE